MGVMHSAVLKATRIRQNYMFLFAKIVLVDLTRAGVVAACSAKDKVHRRFDRTDYLQNR